MTADWIQDAACAAHDPEHWHPHSSREDEALHAKRICAGCPARLPCLEFAVANVDLTGIWAGTTTQQRGRMRKAAWVAS